MMTEDKITAKVETHQTGPTESMGRGEDGRPKPCWVIIFGASGDLAARKLIPALFRLYRWNLLPESFAILGCARSGMTDDSFREKMDGALKTFVHQTTEHQVKDFLQRCFYLSGDYQDSKFYGALSDWLDRADSSHGSRANRLFYLSTPPSLIGTIISGLGENNLSGKSADGGSWAHVIVEKPFGRDLQSARELDRQLHEHLSEDQIYRIDHYLGKETVQSILMLRFANSIFEPLTNHSYIDNVQITVAETVGVENRAGYYEQAGLIRDMFQNHMLQMMALIAMEAPAAFHADRVRDEKVKLLRAIHPFPLDELDDWIVRGQYGPGVLNGKEVPGYREEKDVAPDSMTDTFVAAKLLVDNWRWKGVPFYLRSGKRLARRASEIAIVFKPVPHSLFQDILPGQLSPNVLVLNVQPDEGITLTIQAKKPGPRTSLASLDMAFCAREVFGDELTEAYQRLLLDCMLGDQTLFVRADEMELEWIQISSVLEAWAESGKEGKIYSYPAGSWGPKEAEAILKKDGRAWRRI
jgi:glucose-6-phosphate 1-dehydrogenase